MNHVCLSVWFQVVGFFSLFFFFLEVVSLWRGEGAASQETLANIQGDNIYINRDKILPQEQAHSYHCY